MDTHRTTLDTFTLDTLPDLDVVTLGALELFARVTLPTIDIHRFSRPLVVGSGNAAIVGKLLFNETDAIYANESDYQAVFTKYADVIDGAIIISASGGKHAELQSQMLTAAGVRTVLYTTNSHAPSATHLLSEDVHVFPKNREPYTYNTSTYLGMLLAYTNENPRHIHSFITDTVAQQIPERLNTYDAFFVLIPPKFAGVGEMLRTKFDELFGAKVSVRVFTTPEAMHAKTVVPSATECFLNFGVENEYFGELEHRVSIPLPDRAGYATAMAVMYYTVGQIQKQHPPYFKNNIAAYAEAASALFGQTINPIVE